MTPALSFVAFDVKFGRPWFKRKCSILTDCVCVEDSLSTSQPENYAFNDSVFVDLRQKAERSKKISRL